MKTVDLDAVQKCDLNFFKRFWEEENVNVFICYTEKTRLLTFQDNTKLR